jgi:hypothetical protein
LRGFFVHFCWSLIEDETMTYRGLTKTVPVPTPHTKVEYCCTLKQS